MASQTELSPYERWMVKSNLKTITEEGADPDVLIATLRQNGYLRVAKAVESVLKEQRPKMGAIHDLGSPRQDAFDVYIGRKWIDTVYFTPGHTAEEARRSLIQHDNYDPQIKVVKRRLPR